LFHASVVQIRRLKTMTTVKKTEIKLPKAIGANNLTESFGKISLSPEVREFLGSLNARLSVTYSSGSDYPEMRILDDAGKNVCTIDEFVKLGGFRRWVADELKELEKNEASGKKVTLIANFYRFAFDKKIPLPTRMEEANETRFRQFHSMVKIINDHISVIENSIDNDARAYILGKAQDLVSVLYKLMLDCLKAEKLPKEAFEEALFEKSIPKWVYNKLTDKQFTSNLRNNAVVLMFPKGNYLKSVALTTKEISDEPFLTKNEYIVQKSGSIIGFAKSTIVKDILPAVPKQYEKDFEKFLENYMWTLNSPYETQEILEIRCAGKSIPTFKARQKPNPKPGSKARPETEIQKICREAHNILGALLSDWLHMQNLVIPCADPLAYFWSKIITGTDDWEISPTHGLYDHIRESKQDLNAIKDLTNDPMLEIMGNILCQGARIPTQSDNGKQVIAIVKGFKNKSLFKQMANAPAVDPTKYLVDLPTMEQLELTDEDCEKAKKFLGMVSKKKKKKTTKTGQASVRLHTSVLIELEVLKGLPVLPKVKEWIASTFTTNQRHLTQALAARLVAGEVLKYQDKLLDENFDEFRVLETIEEYEDED
jgi:hypothetical protein